MPPMATEVVPNQPTVRGCGRGAVAEREQFWLVLFMRTATAPTPATIKKPVRFSKWFPWIISIR